MRRAIGRGLSQLLGDTTEAVVTPVQSAAVTTLPISSIVANAKQPRKHFDDEALNQLSASILEYGVLQPIIVRNLPNGMYEVVAGERRFRASKLAGLTEIPALIRAASAQVSLEMAIVENVQREDISPMECAWAYRRLVDEFDMTQEEVAQKVGKSRTAIANTLRLLQLPTTIQEAINSGTITEGHARALLMVDSPAKLAALFGRLVAEGLSVRETERLARSSPEPEVPVQPKPKKLDPQWTALADSFSEYFGSPAKLLKTDQGGRLQIDFYSDDELQRILDKLGIG